MFLVFNKDKIYAYGISIITVILLFCAASTMLTDNPETILTGSTAGKQLPIYKVDTQEKKVALTINCAWNDSDIDNILQTLNNNNCKVTFFMVGDWVKKYPEAAKKVKEAGHEIGTHSNTHPHVNNLDYEKNANELKESAKIIKETTGAEVKLYRPPYGEYNDTVIKVTNENGYIPIQWSLDTLDYTKITGEQMWERLKNKITAGDIILMHNGTEHTADSLDMIIKNIKSSGFEVARVSDIIYTENYTIDTNGTQRRK